MANRCHKKTFQFKIIIAILMVVFTMCVPPTFALEKNLFVDANNYCGVDIKSRSALIDKDSTAQINPKEYIYMLGIAAANEKTKLSNDELEIAKKIFTENDSAQFEKLMTKKFGDSTKAIEFINKSAKGKSLTNINIKSLSSKDDSGNSASLRDIAIFVAPLFNSEDANKVFGIKKDVKVSVFSNVNIKKSNKEKKSDEKSTSLSNSNKVHFAMVGSNGDSTFLVLSMNSASVNRAINDSEELLSYALYNFRTFHVIKKDKVATKVDVKDGAKRTVGIVSKSDVFISLPKEADDGIIDIKFTADKEVKAPVKAGEKIGKIEVWEVGKVVASVDGFTQESIKKGGIWTKIGLTDQNMFYIAITLVLIIILGTVIKLRRRAIRKKRERIIRQRREAEERRKAEELAEKRRRNWPL
ncbi:MAG: hypothetical protein PUI85_03205 [Eubacteriales bacterium]|nr:hypothetical protein [Eubacteriales bacterium]MDY3333208.1 hypothetical protein [Gallibacter sp.]